MEMDGWTDKNTQNGTCDQNEVGERFFPSWLRNTVLPGNSMIGYSSVVTSVSMYIADALTVWTNGRADRLS